MSCRDALRFTPKRVARHCRRACARVLSAHGLDSLPEAYCCLRYAGHRVDVTRCGVLLRTPITYFHDEWSIEPAQIGAHKVVLHQSYLRRWLCDRPALALSPEDLWRIREACIAALAQA